MVNNAGIGIAGTARAAHDEELREQLEVNVVGQLAVARAVLPLLRRGHGPRSSSSARSAGRIAFPFAGAYHASKFAIEALGDSLRVELEPDGHRRSPSSSRGDLDRRSGTRPGMDRRLRERPGAERYAERMDAF